MRWGLGHLTEEISSFAFSLALVRKGKGKRGETWCCAEHHIRFLVSFGLSPQAEGGSGHSTASPAGDRAAWGRPAC